MFMLSVDSYGSLPGLVLTNGGAVQVQLALSTMRRCLRCVAKFMVRTALRQEIIRESGD